MYLYSTIIIHNTYEYIHIVLYTVPYSMTWYEYCAIQCVCVNSRPNAPPRPAKYDRIAYTTTCTCIWIHTTRLVRPVSAQSPTSNKCIGALLWFAAVHFATSRILARRTSDEAEIRKILQITMKIIPSLSDVTRTASVHDAEI